MTHKATGNQPENAKTRIYGSQPVEPLLSENSQPANVAGTRVRSKTCDTETVELFSTGETVVINCSDFDVELHRRID